MVSQTSIARKLNLSQRTVSLCLAGSDRVAEATRKRVVETAQELGYRPNRSALSMRTGRFNAIAMLQSTHLGYSFLPEQLLVGLQEGLSEGLRSSRGALEALIDAAAQTDVESHLVERARTHLEALPELATPPADAGREFDQAMARFDQILADLEKLRAARRGA